MEKQNENLRDRLLAHLPQPENLAAYREETAALLAKHEKALFWEKVPSKILYAIGMVVWVAANLWRQRLGATEVSSLWGFAGLFYFLGAFSDLRYRIYQSKVDTLKEVKQVQLQILELQASLCKRDGIQ